MTPEQASATVEAVAKANTKLHVIGEPVYEYGMFTTICEPFRTTQQTLQKWFARVDATVSGFGIRMSDGKMQITWRPNEGATVKKPKAAKVSKRYQNLQDIVSEYTTLQEVEFKSIWAQADSLALAASEGWNIDEIKGEIAAAARCSKRTVYYRFKIGIVFPPGKRVPDLSPTIHQLCTNAVDLRTGATDFSDCYAWLDKAAAQEWSTRQLEAAMKAAGHDPKPETVFLLDNEPCTLQRVVKLPLTGTYEGVFNFTAEQIQRLSNLPYGTPLQLTLVQPPAQDESEAA